MKNINSTKDKKEKVQVNHLSIIKSKYILQKIINNLSKKKSLEILHYNNKLQKKLDLNLNDYKNFSQKYSAIEIEIILIKNTPGAFINISNKNSEPYYHIYFNDFKKEIKNYYLSENHNIEKIKIKIDPQITSFFCLFQYCNCIESINFIKFCRNNIYNMSYMFDYCQSLKEINFTNFNTDNVEDMSNMFKECTSLKELNISNFNTNNATKMNHMFFDCESLIKLNLSNFNTTKVKNMQYMFYECSSLKDLNVSNFNTSNVSDMEGMFYECSSLKELDISNFSFNNVTDIKYMFGNCSKELQDKIRTSYKSLNEEAFLSFY